VKSHVAVTEGGLFQFGHSKERRPVTPSWRVEPELAIPGVVAH
jgi:hypothetical protein